MARVVAVDWSGDARSSRRHIWLAEATSPGRLERLESGRDRQQLAEHIALLPGDAVIGLDFAFSFPAWFIAHVRATCAAELWSIVAERGESWLAACEQPFWGRPGCPRPAAGGQAFRQT